MDEAQRARLAAWLSAAAGTPVVLREMALLSGGAVQQNWALDVTRDGQPERWVLRTDNAAVLSVSLPRTAEYALLRAARAAGVTVPEPLFCCPGREVTGAPFFVMRRVGGIAQGHRLVRAAAPGLAAQCATEMARIHSISGTTAISASCNTSGQWSSGPSAIGNSRQHRITASRAGAGGPLIGRPAQQGRAGARAPPF